MKTATIVRATVLAAGITPVAGLAETAGSLTGNVGFTNNYIWRGVTQTNDGPAISGGLDYGIAGFYAGTWISNVDFATPDGGPADSPDVQQEFEQDWYLGYADSVEDFSYDVGVILYDFPLADDANFTEVYGSVGYGWVSLNAAFTVDSDVDDVGTNIFVEDDVYYSGTVDIPLNEEQGLGLSVTAGRYDFDLAESYNHYNVYLNKSTEEMGSFSFGVEVNDQDGNFPTNQSADERRFRAAWSKSFELM